MTVGDAQLAFNEGLADWYGSSAAQYEGVSALACAPRARERAGNFGNLLEPVE